MKTCRRITPDFVICNAGILSTPEYTQTEDGFEYTFQVNFLAHLLINEIIIRSTPDHYPLKIASVTSPVYKMAILFLTGNVIIRNYRPLKAYSESKLFLAMMGSHLAAKYPEKKLECFSIDPGTFRSSIYRNPGQVLQITLRHSCSIYENPLKVG